MTYGSHLRVLMKSAIVELDKLERWDGKEPSRIFIKAHSPSMRLTSFGKEQEKPMTGFSGLS
jgi:hypothetical protein